MSSKKRKQVENPTKLDGEPAQAYYIRLLTHLYNHGFVNDALYRFGLVTIVRKGDAAYFELEKFLLAYAVDGQSFPVVFWLEERMPKKEHIGLVLQSELQKTALKGVSQYAMNAAVAAGSGLLAIIMQRLVQKFSS
ncbi:uncharacterized protein SPPG_04316 [Spizellomyces punctatus DAOM BR117]|uniref:Uncharacterized protein n=1 Tax=Spizellomyces punctatus (strain DAOM BR117) TaxID=645134 RepID=A0A0L0HK14_SPIPD|nr:uncharacterized protein SPPG_04316 [Spizellomyces punctatus DAOM BR117]KND01225.1 hypothetical protein SPPG_04316 [Spizellomyces punctatus DAOM BR117]|eukprot:XP_016609264.1 hypothetical protein SPPG_04316 [Spizellomyces punctatus DAOM BR117]